jgi:hypothetical protein
VNKRRLLLFALLGLAAALVVALALRTRQPPRLPQDRDHARFISSGACLGCHAIGGVMPRGPRHPPSDDCMRCHGMR